jgi:hypothetical protein
MLDAREPARRRRPDVAPPHRPAAEAEHRLLALQRSAGNQAVARLLARNGKDGPTMVAPPQPGPRAESAEAIRQRAIAYWERLIDYYLRWGYFPWDRGRQRPAPEYEQTVDPARKAADEHAYQQARAQLREEAQAKPLHTIIGSAVEAAGVNLDWYEQMITTPHETLMTLSLSTPEEICEQINARDDKSEPITADDLDGMDVKSLLERMLAARTITQSCGQTAGLVHEVISPSTVNQHRWVAAEDVRRAIQNAARRAEETGVPAYVRVEGGGHAFVIEVHEGVCRIYQSFISASTLATDMARDASYTPEELLGLLQTAMTPNPPQGTPPSDVLAARRQLFMSQAYHPTATERFQVTEFRQEAGAQQRLEARYRQGVRNWQPELSQPATSKLKAPEAEQAAPEGELTIAVGDSDAQFTAAGGYDFVRHTELKANTRYGLLRAGHFIAVEVLKIDNGVITCRVLTTEELDDEDEPAETSQDK